MDDDPYRLENLLGDDMATVFFSDLHIGDVRSKHTALLDYLCARQSSIDRIVILGDLLDLWVASLDEALSIAAPLLEFLSTNYAGRVHYLIGNHDDDLLPLRSIFPFIHKSLRFPVGNKSAIALHGHILDDVPYINSKFSQFVNWGINLFNRWAIINEKKSWVSLSSQIENDANQALIDQYEQKIGSVFNGKYDYVITGHTHVAGIKRIGNLVYINAGDQINNSTVVIASKDAFYLYDYIAKKTLAIERI